MRPLAASLGMLLATITMSACGGSTSATATRAATASPAATATVAAPKPAAAAATTYRTHLERAVAQAFESALLATPIAPTESQIPPKIKLLLRDPPTVCRRLRAAVYRCSLAYQLPSAPRPLHVTYVVRRARNCFTATAAAIGADSTLHRLANC